MSLQGASVPPGDWTQVGAERVAYDGFTRVVVRRYRLPDGRELDWDLLDAPASVAVLALTDEDQMVLVEQFRPGPGRVVLSLPGGLVDPGEAPVDAGERELLEETGYAASSVELVGRIDPINAVRPWHVAVARGCTPTGHRALDEFEDIRVVLLDVASVRARLHDATIGSMAQIYLALDHLGRL
ncbi:MAG: NUDIX hydrolase [Nocardioides sp.]|nr:NUDIX hydrolase [Nocardioides sp.]